MKVVIQLLSTWGMHSQERKHQEKNWYNKTFENFLKFFWVLMDFLNLQGSRRFKEVQEGSRRFREVQRGSRRFYNVKKGSRWSMRTQKNFKKFSNGLQYHFFSWCFLSCECIPHVERSWITTFIIFLHETENCTNIFSQNLSNLKNKCMYLRFLDNAIISRRV